MIHDCNQNIESNMTPAHCSVCGKEILRTLEEEREAIVEKLTMALTHSEQGEYAKNEKFVRDIILSHEEKVVARVREEKHKIEILDNGAVMTIDDDQRFYGFKRMTNPLMYEYEVTLTLPITDENV